MKTDKTQEFYITFNGDWYSGPDWFNLNEDKPDIPTTFNVKAVEINTSNQRRFKNLLSYKKYKLYFMSCSSYGSEILKEGWPFLIPGCGNKWFYVGKDCTTIVTVPLNINFDKIRKVIPLNQFDRGFTNEEILNYDKTFCYKI